MVTYGPVQKIFYDGSTTIGMKYNLNIYQSIVILLLGPTIVFAQKNSLNQGDSTAAPKFDSVTNHSPSFSIVKYWTISKASLAAIDKAKDSADIESAFYYADSLAKAYINDYPDKPQGYYIRVMAAEKADRDTNRGLAVEPINDYVKFLVKDTAVASKQTACYNLYYLFLYYYIHQKAINSVVRFEKAINVLKQIVQLSPDPHNELYFAAKSVLDSLDSIKIVPGRVVKYK